MPIISLRGDGAWRGRSTRGVVERGDRRMLRIVNGYVSGDGHEIRQWPGYHTLVDLTEANNAANGYFKTIIDVLRPVIADVTQNYHYSYLNEPSSQRQTLLCRARPTHIHGYEQVRGQLVVWGESDFRKAPILSSARVTLTVVGIAVVAHAGDDVWELTMSATIAGFSNSDSTGAGLNGLALGDIVWIENVVSATIQASLDATLNGRFHRIVNGPSLAKFRVATKPEIPAFSEIAATGTVYRTRSNRSEFYPTPGLLPYTGSEYVRVDDPDALTAWRMVDYLDLEEPRGTCYPSWVANRQRDCDDEADSVFVEGVRTEPSGATFRSVSRRRQRSLPYRTNPALAGNRILLAAPGYLCLFQIPLIVPVDPRGFPSPPTAWTEQAGAGVFWFLNDLMDKPRALGVPKGGLIESVFTPAPTSPSAPKPWNFSTFFTLDPAVTWPAGEWSFAISYRDEWTGEEGLASDRMVIPVPVPTATEGYGIQLNYLHPGYLMPECLAMTLNVYVGEGPDGPMGLYISVPLRQNVAVTSPIPAASAKYGINAGTSPLQIHRTFALPLPINTSPLSNAINFTRLAPQSFAMSRGAEAVIVIRGVRLSVGHSGTHGNAAELQRSVISTIFNSAREWLFENQVMVRGFRSRSIVQTSTPVSVSSLNFLDGPFAAGGHYFPSAYSGVEIHAQGLFAEPRKSVVLDRVLNFASENFNPDLTFKDTAYHQRIKTLDPVHDQDIGVVGSPYPNTKEGVEAYLALPRGQVELGDPGAPWIAAKTRIKFMDGNQDDDGLAIGNLNGAAILCSRRETFHLGWNRDPSGYDLQQVTEEFGCIATNSMVQFDGGLAWISVRGPVAIGASFSHIGGDLEEDFHGSNRRYALDSKGLMRHCWSAHDRIRGLVMWGLVTEDSSHTVSHEGVSYTFATAPDKVKSRFPCNEILVWSYRAAAFSYWRPPAGLEVLWMRPLVDKNGHERMTFLAADKRIYALDDQWHDTNRAAFYREPTNTGLAATSLTIFGSWFGDGPTGGGGDGRGTIDQTLRVGMPVLFRRVNSDGKPIISGQTTIAALNYGTQVITLTDPMTWDPHSYTVQIGNRPEMEIQTSYLGETIDNLSVKAIHVRYHLAGTGEVDVPGTSLRKSAGLDGFMDATIEKTDLRDSGRTVGYAAWKHLGYSDTGPEGHRRQFSGGRAESDEVSVKLRVNSQAQVRITDILLETA